MRSRTAVNLSPASGMLPHVPLRSLRQLPLLIAGCLVLGTGVAMLLTADLGSDGFSTLVNGTAISSGLTFFIANLGISAVFLMIAATRRLWPGIGTLVQIVIVGLTTDRLLHVL